MSVKNNISWRHHYLPEFYIKKFYTNSNKLWVYDKVNDKILKDQKSARSIFFEKSRNTIQIKGIPSDFIERLYAKFDSELAIHFNKIDSFNRDQLEDDELFVPFLYSFINWLYWRLPVFDKLNEEYIKRNENIIKHIGEDKFPDLYKNLSQASKIKLNKSLIPFLLLQKPFKSKKEKLSFRIYENDNPVFILTDSPLIIKKFPGLENIITNPVIIPISSNKLYFTLDNEEYLVNADVLTQVNLIMMYNAEKYFASPDRKILEGFIKGYKVIKDSPNINILVRILFEKLNKR